LLHLVGSSILLYYYCVKNTVAIGGLLGYLSPK